MRLFVKIFLWFLAAIGLMTGVVIFITRTFQTEPMFSRWQRAARTQMTIWSGTADQIYQAQGEAGLKLYAIRQRDSEALKDFDIVDAASNTSIGGSTALQDFDGVIQRADAAGGPEIDTSPEDSALGAIPVTFKDGKKVFLIARWNAPRAPSLFFGSSLAYMRLAGLLLTAVLVCYLLALYLTSPIRKLREATRRLASGDLQARVPGRVSRRRDELSDLARDFDHMAERIEGLILSQKRLNQDISHELRSPLARLNVALEIAKQKSNRETAPILDRIENESNRLNEMISRLLILAKLETGSVDVEPVEVDFDELVRGVAEDADFEASAKGKKVTVANLDDCSVVGSDDLLRSAVENVLRNAVRYTKEGTAVEVRLNNNNGHAVLSITDHGGGVPEGELQNLFRPFYRVGEARDRTTGGTGLGLAIAERAIKAHKGSITAKNVGDGLLVEISLDRA
ncbi:MAG: HAMP domain-containing protein [Acidobacteria bacterium]|nr:HAMP domain-containing protein [Acidobacteriota bacterium]